MSQVLLGYYLQLFVLVGAQWPQNNNCLTPDQQMGSCIPIHDCNPILNFLDEVQNHISREIQRYLRSYQCGFEGKEPKVCCPNGPIAFNVQNSGDSDFPDVSRHRNLRLLPTNCGYLDTDDKIIGGEKTGIFEFPWMALLSYRTENGPEFKCGGTIINDKYILTAAHCLKNVKWPILGVRVGEHNIRTQTDCETTRWETICAPPYQDLRIEDIITHSQYNSRDLSSDIALIRVSRIDFSLENSQPVCLPLAESRTYNFTGRNAIVTGWGVTEKGITSPELLKVSLSVRSFEQCQNLYRNITKLHPNQMCAGGKQGKDSCAGDSGGPLHVLGTINGNSKMVQQGIVSFGPARCGQVPIPGVYTRVAAFMDWILNNLKP